MFSCPERVAGDSVDFCWKQTKTYPAINIHTFHDAESFFYNFFNIYTL